MPPLFFNLVVWAVLPGATAAILVIVCWRFFRRRQRRLSKQPFERRCQCGYLLKGLPFPRCPECGRAIGFDKSFEELGIAPDEMRPRDRPRPPP